MDQISDEMLDSKKEDEPVQENSVVSEPIENTVSISPKNKKHKPAEGPSRDDELHNALIETLEEISGKKLIQKEIAKKMAEVLGDDKPIDQGRVSKLIKELVKKKEVEKISQGIYRLTEKGAFEHRIKELEECFEWTTGSKPVFETEVKIGVFKAYTRRNGILAQEIKKTFRSKIVSIFCPNNTDIVIYYKGDCGEDTLEKELRRLCKKREGN